MNRHDFELLGNKHKRYEQYEDHAILPGLPVIIRLDGRAFHTFTRGLKRPYDEDFSKCMIDTTRYLVTKLHAAVGYTQSDEISLAFMNRDPDVEMMFGGRVQKLASITAAMASVQFNKEIAFHLPAKAEESPIFDARVYAYPAEELAAESFLWRETDATRNSISMAAQAHFSHGELQNKGRSAMHEMLFQKGINWNDYPDFFKRGTYVRRFTVQRFLTAEELLKIPEEHRPDGAVTRSVTQPIPMPPIHRVSNRVAALFNGAVPILNDPNPVVVPETLSVINNATGAIL